MTTPTSLTVGQERLRANAWGRYYVTDACDGCGLCASHAPANFASNFDRTFYGVIHQPLGTGEERAMRAAMDACPLRCIHDDGDEY